MSIFGKGKGFRRALALLLCLVTVAATVQLGAIPAVADDGDTVTVTVNYVYDSNKSMVAQPYRAQIAKGSEFKRTLEVPTVLNYSVPSDKAEGLAEGITLSKNTDGGDYKLDFTLAAVNEDITVTLYYVAGSAKYTVKHYYQNIDDDGYGEPTTVELVGDIDAYTAAVAYNTPGFYCKGVPEHIIAADGTTTVEIYYDREYYTVVFDVNGGLNGPTPIYAKYGTPYDSSAIATPTRAGYNFKGWSPALSGTVEADVTYTAQWEPKSTTADYTVVIWGQNANNDEYSYISSHGAYGRVGEDVNWGVLQNHTHTADCLTCGYTYEHTHTNACYEGAGSKAMSVGAFKPQNPQEGQVYQGIRNTYIYIGGSWYYYTGSTASGSIAQRTCGKTEHEHVESCYSCKLTNTSTLHPGESLWIYEKSDTVTVDANGSTVLNVYFKRREFTLRFRKANSSRDDYGTITARWGKDIKKEYEAILEKAGDSFWSEKKDASSPWTNYIGVMPKEDKTFYLKTDSSREKSTMTYYGADLNGDYQLMFSVTFNGTRYTITDEDQYEFEGYAYDHSNKRNGENCNGAEFYYTRKTYKLEFYSASNSTPDKSADVLYQEPLKEYDYTPTKRPDTVEGDAIFVGWYQNPECTGDKYDLSTHTMPANNVALYAKWVNGLYTVRTFTDDKLTTPYTYDGYNGVQENIEKYTLATAPTSPKEDGYVFVGWFYNDGNGEQPFSFTMPITRNYDLYPKFSVPRVVTYTVHYYIENTTTKLAEDRTNTVTLGTNVTERAKMGTELTLAGGKSYFPMKTSTSVIVSIDGQEIIFYYKEATSVKYTVYYQDAVGNNLLTPVEKQTDFSTVTEQYVPINGYSPRQFSITLDLSADESENKIIFIYDPTHTSLKITKAGAEAVDANQTFIFTVVGTDDNTSSINVTVTIHGNGSVTVDDLPVGSYTVTELTDWSWRYEPTDPTVGNITLAVGGSELTFTNERKNDKWLDGDASCVNNFTRVADESTGENN